ncbi:hypothetical protein NECID01_1030 [Nematocida sp. AWRm77]|nr:hypothetical protein NECID01_1030 [Nematocida sp. AWRm77]
MGLLIGRRSSVREVIMALEIKIEKKEKTIKDMTRRRAFLSEFILKILLGVNLLCVISVWVFKESLSWRSIFKGLVYSGIAEALLIGLRKLLLQVWQRMIDGHTEDLKKLRRVQKQNIESLKKETKYYETQDIIDKYEKHRAPKEEKEQTVVEKIVNNLI